MGRRHTVGNDDSQRPLGIAERELDVVTPPLLLLWFGDGLGPQWVFIPGPPKPPALFEPIAVAEAVEPLSKSGNFCSFCIFVGVCCC